MTRPGEWMLREIAEIPQVIARQMAHHGADYAETGATTVFYAGFLSP